MNTSTPKPQSNNQLHIKNMKAELEKERTYNKVITSLYGKNWRKKEEDKKRKISRRANKYLKSKISISKKRKRTRSHVAYIKEQSTKDLEELKNHKDFFVDEGNCSNFIELCSELGLNFRVGTTPYRKINETRRNEIEEEEEDQPFQFYDEESDYEDKLLTTFGENAHIVRAIDNLK